MFATPLLLLTLATPLALPAIPAPLRPGADRAVKALRQRHGEGWRRQFERLTVTPRDVNFRGMPMLASRVKAL